MFWERGPCSGVAGEELPENVSLRLCEVLVRGSWGSWYYPYQQLQCTNPEISLFLDHF